MGIAAITQGQVDNLAATKKTEEANIETKFDPTLKAFALVVLSEINLLRVEAGLPERTVEQLKAAVEAKL